MWSGIGLRQAMLLGVAVVAYVLVFAVVAWAGETASGSTETLELAAPSDRAVGMPMTLTVEGTADGLHRLFLYGEVDRRDGCQAWPYQEQAQKGVVALTSAEGEPLSTGRFSKGFVVVAASEWYGVCGYLDTTASANPDVFEDGCYHMPSHITSFPEVPDISSCFMSYLPWWVGVVAAQEAKKLIEAKESENQHRVEAEEAQRRASEEAPARLALQEAERRRRFEEDERGATARRLCRVPALQRHTLTGVRRLLREANCHLGRITTHHAHGKLVVKSQSPKHSKTLPYGSMVSIVLTPASR